MPKPNDTCGTCVFYTEGYCYRYPPQVELWHQSEDSIYHPTIKRPKVKETDRTCGEFK